MCQVNGNSGDRRQDPQAGVLRFGAEVQPGYPLDDLARHCHPASVDPATPGSLPPAPGAEGAPAFRQFGRTMRAPFSDLPMTVEATISQEAFVVMRKIARSTHLGEWWGEPHPGKPGHLAVIAIFRVADGRLSEHWTEPDRLASPRQLGMRSPSFSDGGRTHAGVLLEWNWCAEAQEDHPGSCRTRERHRAGTLGRMGR